MVLYSYLSLSPHFLRLGRDGDTDEFVDLRYAVCVLDSLKPII